MGLDPHNHVTLVVWTNLSDSLDGLPTANTLLLKVLDHIYAVSLLAPAQASTVPTSVGRLSVLQRCKSVLTMSWSACSK